MKTYNKFQDRFGNEYSFNTYLEFTTFWFSLSRKLALNYFPLNFKSLQKEAISNKKERNINTKNR